MNVNIGKRRIGRGRRGKVVAIFVNQGIGDLIMAWPMIHTIVSKIEENSEIILIVGGNQQKRILEAALKQLYKNTIIVIKVFERDSIYLLVKLLWQLRKRKPTICLFPHATPGSKMCLYAKLIGGQRSIGPAGDKSGLLKYDKTMAYGTEHKVEYYIKYAKSMGLEPARTGSEVIRMELPPPRGVKQWMEEMGLNAQSKKWIFFAPGCDINHRHKRWPIKYYAKLGKLLLKHDNHLHLGLFGSADERHMLCHLATEINDRRRVTVINENDIIWALHALKKALCLVCGCCGPAHMAAAMGVPIIGIYGPTNHELTGPYTDKLIVIKDEMSCTPCYRPKMPLGCGNPVCLSNIKPDMVLNRIVNSGLV